MAEGKKSVLLYCDIIHTVEKLDNDTAGELFKHYLRYVNDLNPSTGNPIVDLVFEPIKQDLIRQFYNSREKHWNWKGGVTTKNKAIRNSTQAVYWRKSVFDRDKYTCQDCGVIGGRLEAHHIKSFKSYPLLRFELSNGVTLCYKCHKIKHKKR